MVCGVFTLIYCVTITDDMVSGTGQRAARTCRGGPAGPGENLTRGRHLAWCVSFSPYNV